ncbi:Signal transduction histidine kinase [Marivirga sericea]|uniref:histidine kinase n=1 Tax=Marivirga sericea TaxID=1028 RepID=A0A1X7KND8_9BACT|nr:ATP-binding protein [Marivirga sericea]SMG42872.1 Signal transduction histidine kinase [Marivirga sericea]
MVFLKSLLHSRNRKAWHLFLFIILFELPTLNAASFQNANPPIEDPKDSIIFRDFDGSSYRGSSFNYMSVEDQDGIMYFGNENGLLEFDGTHWQLHKTTNFTPIEYLNLIDDKIYTYGNQELGYFQRNSLGNMMYQSLNDKMQNEKKIPFVWNVIQNKGYTYFSLDSALLKWDGEVLSRIEIGASITSYKVGQEVLISVYGQDQGGLALLKDDSLIYVNRDFKFGDDYIWEVVKQKNRNWLFFTSENGIYNYNSTTHEVTPFDSEISYFYKSDSLFLYWAHKMSDSLYITSSWENGMQIFDSEGHILKNLSSKNGLLSNFIVHPESDRRSNLWLTSGSGIQYLEFRNPSNKLRFEPQAKVRYIKLGDSSVFIKGLDHVVTLSQENSNSIDFYFSVPSFFKEDLEFSYYLEGFDNDWSTWSNNSRKEYTNLAGGEYIFHLKARGVHNPELNIKPFNFTVIVPKNWYESYVTYILFALLVGLLVFSFIKYRTHRLSITNKKLESIVKERTSELRLQKEQLKKANEELKTINNELDNFVYRSSHDLVAPLKSLRGLIAVAGMSNNPDEIKEYFKLMNISITKLEEFIKGIMDFSTNTKKPLEMKFVRMDDILDSIVEDLKYYQNADRVELIRAYDSDFKIKTDPKRINIVVSNLVTNALKYHDFNQDDPQFIKVSAKIEDNSYVLEVKDNGSGIPEEHQSKIFEMFFRAHQGIEGSGLGLYIVLDTLKVLKGKIEFTSKTRVGTTFRVTLPLID